MTVNNEVQQSYGTENVCSENYEKYKCTNCGVINESNGVPSHCIKCENTKFYKV